jgi:hypothetical protein
MSILRNAPPASQFLTDEQKLSLLEANGFKPDAGGVLTKHLLPGEDRAVDVNAEAHRIIAGFMEYGIKIEHAYNSELGGFTLWPKTDSFNQKAVA